MNAYSNTIAILEAAVVTGEVFISNVVTDEDGEIVTLASRVFEGAVVSTAPAATETAPVSGLFFFDGLIKNVTRTTRHGEVVVDLDNANGVAKIDVERAKEALTYVRGVVSAMYN